MYARSHTTEDGASLDSVEIQTSPAMAGRERPGDRVVRGGGEDRRVTPRERVKMDAVGGKSGQLVWRICRDLVMAATRGTGVHGGGAMNRRQVAAMLETTPMTLERMMASSTPLNFRADHLHALMTAETLVPEAARMVAGAMLAREWGGIFVPQSAEVKRCEAVNVAALELSADAGIVAGLVASAQAGGAVDAPAIEAAAMAAQRAAGQVMQAVGTSPRRREEAAR